MFFISVGDRRDHQLQWVIFLGFVVDFVQFMLEESKEVRENWRGETIVPLYKNEDCASYMPISLLSLGSKCL